MVEKEEDDEHIDNHYMGQNVINALEERQRKTREEGSLHLAAEEESGSRENFLLEMTFELILNRD